MARCSRWPSTFFSTSFEATLTAYQRAIWGGFVSCACFRGPLAGWASPSASGCSSMAYAAV